MDRSSVSRARRHLMSWATGREDFVPPADTGARTVVLDRADQVHPLLSTDLVGAGSLVLYPAETGTAQVAEDAAALVLPFEGTLTEPGADLVVGEEFFLQVQDYASSAFLSIIGPTLVRFFEEQDVTAYLEDADAARTTGTFPSFILNPVVMVADVEALGGPGRGDGPRTRLHVDETGRVGLSPASIRLGELGSPMAELEDAWRTATEHAPWPGSVALGGVVPDGTGVAATVDRPWLGRYLTACEALRRLTMRGVVDVRVSGFGHRLTGTDAEADLTDTGGAMVAWTADQSFVCLPSGRMFEVQRRFAEILEAVLSHGGAPAATDQGYAEDEVRAVAARCAEAGVALPETEPA